MPRDGARNHAKRYTNHNNKCANNCRKMLSFVHALNLLFPKPNCNTLLKNFSNFFFPLLIFYFTILSRKNIFYSYLLHSGFAYLKFPLRKSAIMCIITCVANAIRGRVSEWSNVLVSKTSVPQGTVGSNPTPSASHVSTRTCG